MSVQYDLVEINKGNYLKVLKCFSEEPKSKTEQTLIESDILFIIIPGNPGVIEFYEHFAIELYKSTNQPVIGISHTGHVFHEDVKHWDPINLMTQINHKVKILEQHLTDKSTEKSLFEISKKTKLVFIGHSVGCYINMQILNLVSDEIKQKIKKMINLFPTIERMSKTPNGRVLTFAATFFSWLVYLLMYVFSLLPLLVQRVLIDFLFTRRHHKNSLADNIEEMVLRMSTNYSTLRSCFFMGHDEMKNVLDLDEDIIKKYSDLILLYYGQKDNWCPLDFYHSMKERVSNFSNEPDKLPAVLLDTNKLEHAFVIYKNQCSVIIEKIRDWIGLHTE